MTTPDEVVPGQSWTDLDVPTLGDWTPTLGVSVVLPARDCQAPLDLTLAALSAQSYPAELLEVVVVDDGSDVPLQVRSPHPARTRLVRLEDAPSHGSGRARHAGAEAAESPIVLFLDADMLADHQHVESHARWHHLSSHAVVLGRKWFVDVDGLTPHAVREAASTRGGLLEALRGRKLRRHDWQEDLIAGYGNLTREVDDAFLAVVGATVSVRRSFYHRVGGFAAFGLRGIVDTEFGYRAWTRGALLVPDDDAHAVHQGRRNFASRGDEIKLARTGLAANHLPIPMFRKHNAGRSWVVPQVEVQIAVRGDDPAAVQVTVDSVLGSTLTDLRVSVITGSAGAPSWLADYFTADHRVRFCQDPPGSGFPSPVTALVSPGLVLEPTALGRAVDLLAEAGVARTLPGSVPGAADSTGVEVWRTRAWERSAEQDDPDDAVERLFGVRWVPAPALGVRRAVVSTTKQGMITGH